MSKNQKSFNSFVVPTTTHASGVAYARTPYHAEGDHPEDAVVVDTGDSANVYEANIRKLPYLHSLLNASKPANQPSLEVLDACVSRQILFKDDFKMANDIIYLYRYFLADSRQFIQEWAWNPADSSWYFSREINTDQDLSINYKAARCVSAKVELKTTTVNNTNSGTVTAVYLDEFPSLDSLTPTNFTQYIAAASRGIANKDSVDGTAIIRPPAGDCSFQELSGTTAYSSRTTQVGTFTSVSGSTANGWVSTPLNLPASSIIWNSANAAGSLPDVPSGWLEIDVRVPVTSLAGVTVYTVNLSLIMQRKLYNKTTNTYSVNNTAVTFSGEASYGNGQYQVLNGIIKVYLPSDVDSLQIQLDTVGNITPCLALIAGGTVSLRWLSQNNDGWVGPGFMQLLTSVPNGASVKHSGVVNVDLKALAQNARDIGFTPTDYNYHQLMYARMMFDVSNPLSVPTVYTLPDYHAYLKAKMYRQAVHDVVYKYHAAGFKSFLGGVAKNAWNIVGPTVSSALGALGPAGSIASSIADSAVRGTIGSLFSSGAHASGVKDNSVRTFEHEIERPKRVKVPEVDNYQEAARSKTERPKVRGASIVLGDALIAKCDGRPETQLGDVAIATSAIQPKKVKTLHQTCLVVKRSISSSNYTTQEALLKLFVKLHLLAKHPEALSFAEKEDALVLMRIKQFQPDLYAKLAAELLEARSAQSNSSVTYVLMEVGNLPPMNVMTLEELRKFTNGLHDQHLARFCNICQSRELRQKQMLSGTTLHGTTVPIEVEPLSDAFQSTFTVNRGSIVTPVRGAAFASGEHDQVSMMQRMMEKMAEMEAELNRLRAEKNAPPAEDQHVRAVKAHEGAALEAFIEACPKAIFQAVQTCLDPWDLITKYTSQSSGLPMTQQHYPVLSDSGEFAGLLSLGISTVAVFGAQYNGPSTVERLANISEKYGVEVFVDSRFRGQDFFDELELSLRGSPWVNTTKKKVYVTSISHVETPGIGLNTIEGPSSGYALYAALHAYPDYCAVLSGSVTGAVITGIETKLAGVVSHSKGAFQNFILGRLADSPTLGSALAVRRILPYSMRLSLTRDSGEVALGYYDDSEKGSVAFVDAALFLIVYQLTKVAKKQTLGERKELAHVEKLPGTQQSRHQEKKRQAFDAKLQEWVDDNSAFIHEMANWELIEQQSVGLQDKLAFLLEFEDDPHNGFEITNEKTGNKTALWNETLLDKLNQYTLSLRKVHDTWKEQQANKGKSGSTTKKGASTSLLALLKKAPKQAPTKNEKLAALKKSWADDSD